jgi:predicted DNA-binding ribbon-helix-helix protein
MKSPASLQSPVVKRSIVIGGHKTSVSLEDEFWNGLKQVAASRSLTLSELVGTIDLNRKNANLSSTLRLFLLDHYRTQALRVESGSRPRSEATAQAFEARD